MTVEAALLTPCELAVLRLVGKGQSNKQIGRALGKSRFTVANHLRAVMQRLNAKDRTHAVVLAVGHGLLSLDELG